MMASHKSSLEKSHTQKRNVYVTTESGRPTILSTDTPTLDISQYFARDEDQPKRSYIKNQQQAVVKSPEVQKVSTLTKMAVMGTCFCTNFLCLGFGTGLGVIFVPVLDLFQTSRAQTSLMLSLCMGVIFSGALFSGPVVRRFNPSNAVSLGGLLAIIGCLGGSFATDVNILILSVGLITGMGLSLACYSSFVTITAVLTTRRGLGVALLTAASGSGGLLAPLLNVWLLDLYGWRGAFLILGGLLFNLTLLGLIVRCLKTDILVTKLHSTQTKSEVNESLIQSFHLGLFKRPTYAVFIVCQLPVYIFFISQVMLSVDIATNRGYSLQMSTYLLSSLTLGNVAGSLLAGILNSCCGLPGLLTATITAALAGLSSLGFAFADSYLLMVVCSVSFGAGFGAYSVAGQLSLLQLVVIDEYPAALSFFFGISGIGDLLSGPVGGAVRDITGSYKLLFILCAVVGVVMGTICLLLEIWVKRMRRKYSFKINHCSTATIVNYP